VQIGPVSTVAAYNVLQREMMSWSLGGALARP